MAMAAVESNSDSAAPEEVGSGDSKFINFRGPRSDVKYPLNVIYCGECSMPLEYCEYYPCYDKCKEWLRKHLPDQFELLFSNDEVTKKEEGGEGKTKRQTRGGKGVIKAKKKTEPQGITLVTATRGKKKKVTIVTGLATYDIDLKEAAKACASKYSCGSSVTGDDEIVIQGDIRDELIDFLQEKFPQIDEDNVEDLGEMRK